MEEKKVLSAEEIESQTPLELPDRQLPTDVVTVVVQLIVAIFNGGGGGGTTVIPLIGG